MDPVSGKIALSYPLHESWPPTSNAVEKDCSQLLLASAFTDDLSSYTLPGDSIKKEESGGPGPLPGNRATGAPSGLEMPPNSHFGFRWYSPAHLGQRVRIPVRRFNPVDV